MLKSNSPLSWTTQHKRAMERIIQHLSEEAQLRLPDLKRPFVLEVTHTRLGYGGVLL